MKLKTLISNARFLLEKMDILSYVNDIKDQRKYDLDGDDDDAHADDLEEMETLLDDLEHAYNLILDKLDEIDENGDE
jgi:hypothetical protein